jgi:hypothetical protein
MKFGTPGCAGGACEETCEVCVREDCGVAQFGERAAVEDAVEHYRLGYELRGRALAEAEKALALSRRGQHMHGVDVCGYCVEGDLAKTKLRAAEERAAQLERALRLIEEYAGTDMGDYAWVRMHARAALQGAAQ